MLGQEAPYDITPEARKIMSKIIFVDTSLEDYQSLIRDKNGTEIVVLNENASGIEQITKALAPRTEIEAIHILSHGSEGSLKLGANVLNGNNIETFSNQLKQWGNALTAYGDILLYGCHVAAGETGLNFVKHLSEITGADIAASNNITGSAAFGGDWNLEVQFGEIETQPLNFPNYNYTLAGLTGTPDSKAINVSATPTSTAIDVLANDTGIGRLSVDSIVTGPSHGTAIIGDSIYVGGSFSGIGSQSRNNIAKLNSDGTVDTTFNPNANSWIRAIALDSSGNPYVGGDFTSIGGQTRNNIAKLNPTTGTVDTTFNPNADGGVGAIALDSSGNLIVGGGFTTIGGQTRNHIAKLDPITGATDTTFNPNADKPVNAIALDSSGNPIVGGGFTTIGGQTRNHIAKLDPITGAADTTFNPNADNSVDAITIDSSGNPYVGGGFTQIGGQTREYIAKLDPSTGAADTTFNPNDAGFWMVTAIALHSSGNLIVGGWAPGGLHAGHPLIRTAKLNPTTGVTDTTFYPNAGVQFNAIAFDSSDNSIVGGWSLMSISAKVAKFNPTTGAVDTTFNVKANPSFGSSVNAIVIDPKRNILYTPNANFNGVDTFTYTAKDSSGVSTPITVNVLVNVNHSPVLDNSGTPTLTAINQGDSASTGTLISTIIANLGGTKIVDADTGAKQGIAITGLDTTNGTWQYTTDGTTWINAPSVSATNALLLASDANTKIRFVPNASYNGTVTNAITFKAWDKITSTNGGTADVTADLTANGTSSVFSTANETANITVNPTSTTVTPTVTSTVTTSVTSTVTPTVTPIIDSIEDKIPLPNFNQPNATDNVIFGQAGVTQGTDQNDQFNGSSNPNLFYGLGGDDNLIGGVSNDTLFCGLGNDYIDGQDGNDSLYGGKGNDIIIAGFGEDTLFGDSGNDTLNGSEDKDLLYGGKSDDWLSGGDGNDTLMGQKGNDVLFGDQGDDYLDGGIGNDTLLGGSGNDSLLGGEGDDVLDGGKGDNSLNGGVGNDTLYGCGGNNTLTGGSGNDLFIIGFPSSLNIITDFTKGSDKIAVSGASFSQLDFVQDNRNTLIKLKTNGQQIGTLLNVNASQLSADSFLSV